MIAVDTNLLVYAHRRDVEWFPRASECLRSLAQGSEPWAVPWPCAHEFLAIVTHPRIFAPPTPVELALDQLAAWMESPSLVILGEARGYWDVFAELVAKARVAGPLVHDARIAALCLHHGVDELWSADRDFGRFPALRVRNPLAA
ncbi:MAG TPA: TA system VapC family ribonuclease toxin [Thermoleophilia bacterium]|nr:TA system VapC family ribonuclease toxin [Thermoleophilia bacterium]